MYFSFNDRVVFFLLCSKHKALKRKYIRVVTAGEPDLQSYNVDSERDNGHEPHPPGMIHNYCIST